MAKSDSLGVIVVDEDEKDKGPEEKRREMPRTLNGKDRKRWRKKERYILSDKRERGVPLIWQRQPELLEASTNVFWTPMGEDLNGRLCGQPRKLVTSAFSAKSFPCSALPIVAGSSTVKLLLRFRPRVFRRIRGRQNDGERPPVRVLAGPMRS
ncbi:hypothetical protein ALC60_11144 [Trachymyrmex zeteki]|uniref:Uncharacterized protein n=1 Tax=Mycetomoellerius zeteki TaxID=64791 RepID=A0A151WPK2_9HYME|nr:hypothetical protein ALC60_11144 [Trachymyrmex zeteki]